MSVLREAMSHAVLGWVKPELDETLRQAQVEIEAFVDEPADTGRMRFCAGYLHQVQGTLRMVELYAPAMVAEELELLAQALQAGAVADRDDACEALMRGIVLLPDYLERLQIGHRDIPIVLLPLLNELRAARGEPGLNEGVFLGSDAQAPSDAEIEHARGSISGRNRALLDTVGDAVKDELLRVKDALDMHLRTGGEVSALQAQVGELGNVADTLGMMGLGVARDVVVQQRDRLRELADGRGAADENALLDIAGALLFVDASLDDQVARLGHPDVDGGAEDASAAEAQRTVQMVAQEAIVNFASARESFIAFIETGWKHEELAEIPRLLDEVAGALRILNLPQPAEYLTGVRRYIADELIGKRRVPGGQQLDTLADAMASLEYYLEALSERRPNRDEILDITRTSLEKLNYWPLTAASATVVATHVGAEGDGSLSAAPAPAPAPAPEAETEVEAEGSGAEIAVDEGSGPDAVTAGEAPAEASDIGDVPGLVEAVDAEPATAISAVEPEPATEAPPAMDAPARPSGVAAAALATGFDAANDIDDEIREVFLEEFDEEIENLRHMLPAWRSAPGDMERLRPIRRIFHTLKGSGRLVGATALGEYSWKTENMLNRVLDGSRPPSDAVVALLEQSLTVLSQLNAALRGQGGVTADLHGLQAVADRVAAGEELYHDAVAAVAIDDDDAGEPVGDDLVEDTFAATEVDAEGTPASVDEVLREILETEVANHLRTVNAWLAKAQSVPQPADESLLRALHTMNGALAMAEVPEITVVTQTAEQYAKRLLSAREAASPEGVAALAEVVEAIRRSVGALRSESPRIPVFTELASRLGVLRDSLPEARVAAPEQEDEPVVAPNVPVLDGLEAEDADADAVPEVDVAAGGLEVVESPEEETSGLVEGDGVGNIDAVEPEQPDSIPAPQDTQAEAEVSPVESAEPPSEEASPASGQAHDALLEDSLAIDASVVAATVAAGAAVAGLALEAEAEDAAVVDTEAVSGQLPDSVHGADEGGVSGQAEEERVQEGSEGNIEETSPGDAGPDDAAVEEAPPEPAVPETDAADMAIESEEGEVVIVEATGTDAVAVPEETVAEDADEEAGVTEEAVMTMPDADATAGAEASEVAGYGNETMPGAFDMTGLDPDLIDIFVEEAGDLLDHSDALLARLRETPGDRASMAGLQRNLHTLKGGARMAGIGAAGDLGHAIETLLEAASAQQAELDSGTLHLLEQGFDALHQQVAQVNARRAVDAHETLIAQLNARAQGKDTRIGAPEVAAAASPKRPVLTPLSAPVEVESAAPEEDAVTHAPQEQVRVRAELLDRLVNHAGEVAIYRARLEQQLGAFRGAMAELDRTNTRLHDQLRRLDLETEAQIVARYQREHDHQDPTFDPLELDRFSTLQQLSRALAESAADLTGLQGVLDDLSRQYDTLLQQQSRVSSELQDGLMQARMVPFEGLVPRLRRVVRQAASETGKQVALHLDGTHGELDRNVLDRMTAPLEHLLRNSVAHGLEKAKARRAAGKQEEGVVTIALRREGAEMVLRVSDDGAGLNRAAIRKRAEKQGLLAADAEIADAELDRLILEPGFSTSDKVSQLAGRGVGMDVVYNAVRQLGGTLEIDSVPGQGTTFTLRLPQTLAVTQAVFVQIGDTRFAVPVAAVGGVGRIARERLDAADGAYHYGGEAYALHDLGTLVGQAQAKAEGQAEVPLLLVRAGDLRAAVAVDQVLGNREIVVKSIGPQIASLPGIYGATITGDGSVVVILDVAPMVRRHLAQPRLPADSAPAQEQRQVPLVMVVDDSLTMRKVTGRVLERHNFEVMVARDGIEALERLEERVPDLMLLDIEMPRMDGYELATAMKADERFRGVPIVMITSRTGDKHRQRAFDIGVQRYMGKPYQELDLMRNVYDLLGIARVRE